MPSFLCFFVFPRHSPVLLLLLDNVRRCSSLSLSLPSIHVSSSQLKNENRFFSSPFFLFVSLSLSLSSFHCRSPLRLALIICVLLWCAMDILTYKGTWTRPHTHTQIVECLSSGFQSKHLSIADFLFDSCLCSSAEDSEQTQICVPDRWVKSIDIDFSTQPCGEKSKRFSVSTLVSCCCLVLVCYASTDIHSCLDWWWWSCIWYGFSILIACVPDNGSRLMSDVGDETPRIIYDGYEKRAEYQKISTLLDGLWLSMRDVRVGTAAPDVYWISSNIKAWSILAAGNVAMRCESKVWACLMSSRWKTRISNLVLFPFHICVYLTMPPNDRQRERIEITQENRRCTWYKYPCKVDERTSDTFQSFARPFVH